MQAALQAVRRHGAHAQGTLSYTTSPAHTLQTWLDLKMCIRDRDRSIML